MRAAVHRLLLVLIRTLLRIRATSVLGGDGINGGLLLLLVVGRVVWLRVCLLLLLLVDLRRVLILIRVLSVLLVWLLGRLLLSFHLHVANVPAAPSCLSLMVHAECVAVVDQCRNEE
jgi:hypothetical protein